MAPFYRDASGVDRPGWHVGPACGRPMRGCNGEALRSATIHRRPQFRRSERLTCPDAEVSFESGPDDGHGKSGHAGQ